MEYVRLQGATVPALGFGTFRMKGGECAAAVARAITIGYRHLDTAEIYENEEAVATGIRESGIDRGELFVTTKAWMEDLSPTGIQKSLKGSLRRLGTDYIDLWLVHWPNPAFPMRDTISAMLEAVSAGRVKHLGVSNFPVALFQEAVSIAPIVCNQVEYHPYLSQAKVLAAARANDAFVTAYAPVAMGKVREDPVLTEIGDRHGRTPTQVALRWLTQQSNVVAIPKAASPDHAVENFESFGFALTPDEMARIHGLARGERLIDPDFGPEWDEA
jgi:2,5-diketo-D-gluconate reductase B